MKKKSNTIKAVEMMRKIKADMSEEFTSNSEQFYAEIKRLTNVFSSRRRSTAANRRVKNSGQEAQNPS